MHPFNHFGPMIYVEQKLWQAVDCLNAHGDLGDRLRCAANYLAGLMPANFTDHAIFKQWRDTWEDLTVDDARWHGEGRIEATTRDLRGFAARNIEKRIRDLYAR